MFKALFGVVVILTVMVGIGVGSSDAGYTMTPTIDQMIFESDGSDYFNDVHFQYLSVGEATVSVLTDTNNPPNSYTVTTTNFSPTFHQTDAVFDLMQQNAIFDIGPADATVTWYAFTLHDGEGNSTIVYQDGVYTAVPELPAGLVIPMGLVLLVGMVWLRRKNLLLATTAI